MTDSFYDPTKDSSSPFFGASGRDAAEQIRIGQEERARNGSNAPQQPHEEGWAAALRQSGG